MQVIDRYAKEHGINREKAILEFIQNGQAHLEAGGVIPPNQHVSYEENRQVLKMVEEMRQTLDELRREVRLIHHTIEAEWRKEAEGVPFQTRRWWAFWRQE
jgi:hypothetical protein